jgi:hypothetical protein
MDKMNVNPNVKMIKGVVKEKGIKRYKHLKKPRDGFNNEEDTEKKAIDSTKKDVVSITENSTDIICADKKFNRIVDTKNKKIYTMKILKDSSK